MEKYEVSKNFDVIFNMYENLGKIFDSMPESIPLPVKTMLRHAVLDDVELRNLMAGIKNRRPPRFMMVGNSGCGKSSLINAILGWYAKHVSPVQVGTLKAQYSVITDADNNKHFEILDTRGLCESVQSSSQTAEDNLIQNLIDFSPDALIYLHQCDVRSGIEQELEFLKTVIEKSNNLRKNNPAFFIVLTQCDKMDPSYVSDPSLFTGNELKMTHIKERIDQVRAICENINLSPIDIIPVCSLMDWDIDKDQLLKLSPSQQNEHMSLDWRYNIDVLRASLLSSLTDVKAQMGFSAALNIKSIFNKLSVKIINIFSGISASIAVTPIPVSDIFILCTLQALLVMIIAALSGRKITFKAAGELVTSFGGIGAVGFGLRIAAQQLSKFANTVFPGIGSGISAGIAAAGTKTIGECARKYFIDRIEI